MSEYLFGYCELCGLPLPDPTEAAHQCPPDLGKKKAKLDSLLSQIKTEEQKRICNLEAKLLKSEAANAEMRGNKMTFDEWFAKQKYSLGNMPSYSMIDEMHRAWNASSAGKDLLEKMERARKILMSARRKSHGRDPEDAVGFYDEAVSVALTELEEK